CLSVLAASYTATVSLSLHDALPILSRGAVLRRPRSLLAIVRSDRDGGECPRAPCTRARRGPVAGSNGFWFFPRPAQGARRGGPGDRKSTRLNSSHVKISYAVCCLKK